MKTQATFGPEFVGMHSTVASTSGVWARVTLLVNSSTREKNVYVSVIFDDEVELILDVDWDLLLESRAPVTAFAGKRQVTFDAETLDVIETAGWDLLIEQGYFPTVWRGEWPRPPIDTSSAPEP